jgi:transketolase
MSWGVNLNMSASANDKREWANNRDGYGDALIQLGEQNPNVVVVDADLSCSTKTARFGDKYPDRFFNFGVAEQNMMGTAAGLATTGKIVFASTFAMFATGRVHDQIRQSIAYPKLNVKIVATHAGITVGGDGASHQINEDLGLMRVLPNMKIIVPADITETRKAVLAVAEMDGPAYIRLGRSNTPVIFDDSYKFELGKAHILREGTDVTLIAMGQMVTRALDAAEILKSEHDIDARVVNMSTIKPIDVDTIVTCARETGAIVTIEEHNYIVGMGSAVAEVLGYYVKVPHRRVGIPDVFGESGESEELLENYGLTIEDIIEATNIAIKRKTEPLPDYCNNKESKQEDLQ